MQAVTSAIIVLWGWRRSRWHRHSRRGFGAGLRPVLRVPLLWLTVPVFVWLIDAARAEGGRPATVRYNPPAAIGWAFGFGFFVAGLWWIGTAFLVDAVVRLGDAARAVLVLPAGLAFFWAVGVALTRAFWVEGWSRVLYKSSPGRWQSPNGCADISSPASRGTQSATP